MSYCYPLLINGGIIAVYGNDARAVRAMGTSASGFGNVGGWERFPKPKGAPILAGTGELVASCHARSDRGVVLYQVQRWRVERQRYSVKGRT